MADTSTGKRQQAFDELIQAMATQNQRKRYLTLQSQAMDMLAKNPVISDEEKVNLEIKKLQRDSYQKQNDLTDLKIKNEKARNYSRERELEIQTKEAELRRVQHLENQERVKLNNIKSGMPSNGKFSLPGDVGINYDTYTGTFSMSDNEYSQMATDNTIISGKVKIGEKEEINSRGDIETVDVYGPQYSPEERRAARVRRANRSKAQYAVEIANDRKIGINDAYNVVEKGLKYSEIINRYEQAVEPTDKGTWAGEAAGEEYTTLRNYKILMSILDKSGLTPAEEQELMIFQSQGFGTLNWETGVRILNDEKTDIFSGNDEQGI